MSDQACHGSRSGAEGEIARLRRRIQQLQRNERTLERVREHFIAAQRIAHVGSGEWDLIEDRVWWSEELYRVCDHPPDAPATFDAFLDHVHPEDRPRIRRHLDATFERAEPHAAEFRSLRRDGRTRRIRTCARLERTSDGMPARILWTAQELAETQEMLENG